jgi:hypothetical protein
MRVIGLVGSLFLFGCGAQAPSKSTNTESTGGQATGGDSSTSGGASAGSSTVGGSSASGGSVQSTGGAAGGATGGAQATGGTGGTVVVPDLPPDAPVLTPGEWVALNPTESTYPCNKSAYGIAVDPTNPAILYQCSCGIFKSTNAGTEWHQIGEVGSGPTAGQYLDSTGSLRVDPEDPQHLYVADGVNGGMQGFWVSTDGGETFNMPPAFDEHADDSVGGWTTDVYSVSVNPADFNHVLVSFHSPFEFSVGGNKSGILESTDGGDTWKRHFPVGEATGAGWGIWFLHRPDLGIGDASTWLMGVQLGGGHWRTSNAGTSWQKVTDNNMEHGGGQIYYTADGTLYSTGQPRIMRSVDNGVTWEMVGPENQGFIGIVGDGTNMYAKSHDRSTPIITATENDGDDWSDYAPQPEEFFGGSYEFAFDATNRIVYGAFLTAGVMALKLPE